MTGKIRSEETKEKIRNSKKGHSFCSEETRRRMSIARKRYWAVRARITKNLT